jgi:succinate dehydrogenase / fumarate reductase flavoprotein subunit
MEFMQFHPTGMVWPPSVRGILVTEGVRGEGGTLKNSNNERFMFNYIPEFFRKETAETEEEADKWFGAKTEFRRTPDLLPRDEVARAINSEVKAGRGTEHGGVFLDIASRRPADYIRKALPSMYHQFKTLADIDITAVPMEVGPTAHYVMGGVRVDADTGAATVPGLFAAGECAGGMHGANRLGGNSLSDLVVFGRRAGLGAAEYAKGTATQPNASEAEAEQVAAKMFACFENEGTENPYTIQRELQETMHNLVGIIRTKSELEQAVVKIAELRERSKNTSVEGNMQYNPGWHLAMDLESLLTVSEAMTTAALLREESRGGHTREDFPKTDPEWGKWNISITEAAAGQMSIQKTALPQMPADLAKYFEDGK